MRKLLEKLRIVRPHNVAVAVLAVSTGFALSRSQGEWPLLLIAATGLVTASGNVINDYFDHDIDRINKPSRPLPSGLLTRKAALSIYIALLSLLAVMMIVFLPRAQSAWIAAWAILLHLYSWRLKRIYLLGNILVSAVSASGFVLGSFAGGNAGAGFVPAAFTFLFVMGRELVKDTEDLEGDRVCGAKTVPVISGAKNAMRAASVIFILLAIAFPVPYFTGRYGIAYLIVMILSVEPILIVSSIVSVTNRSPARVSLLLKLGMFCGIAAFYLGSKG
jgi:geranylgeranylglycerol-phosphate geranylgeranyltransferase